MRALVCLLSTCLVLGGCFIGGTGEEDENKIDFANSQSREIDDNVAGFVTTGYALAGTGGNAGETLTYAFADSQVGSDFTVRWTRTHSTDGVVATVDLAKAKDGGIYILRVQYGGDPAVVCDPPRLLWPRQLQAGTTWVGGESGDLRFTVVSMDAVAPNGSSGVIHIRVRTAADPATDAAHWYLVPGFGVVEHVDDPVAPASWQRAYTDPG